MWLLLRRPCVAVQISELQLTYLAFDVLYYKVLLSSPDLAVHTCIVQPGITSVQCADRVDTTCSTDATCCPYLLHQHPTGTPRIALTS
jgi:hypothetical protein